MDSLGALAPALALIVVTLVLRLCGVPRLRPWPVALRGGLAAMFTMTGVAHFVGMRTELVAMFPANVHLATSGLATSVVDSLVPRTLLQVLFLAAAIVVAWGRVGVRADERARTPQGVS